MEKEDIKEMLQLEVNKKRDFWDISNVGKDGFVAIFTSQCGKLKKIWEGHWESCIRYIDSL